MAVAEAVTLELQAAFGGPSWGEAGGFVFPLCLEGHRRHKLINISCTSNSQYQNSYGAFTLDESFARPAHN